MKKIGLLGATGSIGTQALDIIRRHPDKFRLDLLTGHSNTVLLEEQIKTFQPAHVVITKESAYEVLSKKDFPGTRLYAGMDALVTLLNDLPLDLVLNSIVGAAGLRPTYAIVSRGIDLALANKESLVVGGALVMDKAKETGSRIIPVDSEHSAIFQSLQGYETKDLKRVILTASGGPFRGLKAEQISSKGPKDALRHPNWDMGSKISIDSATLVNKGLEVIEAKWLFQVQAEQIEVVVHPQSIIHSMIEYQDTSIIAQMGIPDMRLPIHYALFYPERVESGLETFDFLHHPQLTFEAPDHEAFPGLSLAYKAMELGGFGPLVYNTINEIMVDKFLKGQASFYEITDEIKKNLEQLRKPQELTIAVLLEEDQRLRERYR